MKNKKELKVRSTPYRKAYNQCRNNILKLINKRIKDLDKMMECDEKEMWETSDINFIQAKAIYDELVKLKSKIKKK